MWPFDDLFGGSSVPQINSVSDPGALSNSAMQALAAQDSAANPPTMAIPYQNGPYNTMNSSPFAGSGGGLLSSLAGLGGMGGSPGIQPQQPALASPASQPQGGGGMRNIQLPSLNVPGQLGALTAQSLPLGPAGNNPMLLNLLKQRLGIPG
jgi:hypothetical protein